MIHTTAGSLRISRKYQGISGLGSDRQKPAEFFTALQSESRFYCVPRGKESPALKNIVRNGRQTLSKRRISNTRISAFTLLSRFSLSLSSFPSLDMLMEATFKSDHHQPSSTTCQPRTCVFVSSARAMRATRASQLSMARRMRGAARLPQMPMSC